MNANCLTGQTWAGTIAETTYFHSTRHTLCHGNTDNLKIKNTKPNQCLHIVSVGVRMGEEGKNEKVGMLHQWWKNGVFATPYATSEVPRPLCTPMTTSKTLRYQQILRNLAHTPKFTPQRIHRKQFYFVRFLFKFNRCTDSFQSLTFSGV